MLEERQIGAYPLRLYVHPVKLLLLLLTVLGFTVIGFLMLQDKKVRADPFNSGMAFLVVSFFGLALIVALALVLMYVVFRRPWLEITAAAWYAKPYLLSRRLAIPWQDIEDLAIYEQFMSGITIRRIKWYYLVLSLKHPEQGQSRMDRFNARFYSSLGRAGLTLPLTFLFLRTTQKKCELLLARIQTQFAHEIELHEVEVDDEVWVM